MQLAPTLRTSAGAALTTVGQKVLDKPALMLTIILIPFIAVAINVDAHPGQVPASAHQHAQRTHATPSATLNRSMRRAPARLTRARDPSACPVYGPMLFN